MQPFTISCLTCGTKLKVSDESLIGEILMCAKCHSMVLVEPPSRPSDASAAAMSATPSAPAAPPAEPPQTTAADSVAPQSSGDAVQVAAGAVPADEVKPVAPAATQPEAPSIRPSDVEPAKAAAAAIPLAMPTAPPTPWHKWLLYGASGTVGAMFVVSAWLFLKSRDAQSTAVPQPSPSTNVTATAPPSSPPVEQTADSRPNNSPAAVAQLDDARSPDAVNLPQSEGPLSLAVSDDSENDVAAASEPNLDNADAPANSDPLLITEADAAVNVPEADEPTTQETSDDLPFGSRPPVEYPIPDAHPDVAARLATRVAAIELTGDKTSGEVLNHVTTLLSQMTAVPIHLDSVALKQIGKSGDTPVRLKMTNATVAELLDAIFGAWGLAAVATGDHVLVTAAQDGAAAKTYEQRYPFDDLATNAAEMHDMADLIRRTVAPSSWTERGGDGQISIDGANLRITQSPSAHYDILLLCEKLRVARGLRPKSIYFRSDPSALPLESRSMLAASRLAARGDFSTSQQVPLSIYAHSLQHRSGIEFAVDELALYRAGLSPEILVGYDGPERTLAEVLAEVLGPINLAYRIIDATTIQITTIRKLAETAEIEFLQLATMPPGGAKSLLARIKADVAPAYWKSAGDDAYLHFDARSKALIVRAAQPVEQELQAALLDWGVAAQAAN